MDIKKPVFLFLLLCGILALGCGSEQASDGPFDPAVYLEKMAAGLPKARLPMRLDFHPDKVSPPGDIPADSLFVAVFLDPGYYDYLNPQYAYHRPMLAGKEAGYTALLVPFSHSAGHDMRLYTFSGAGDPIDSLTVASVSGYRYYRSARIEKDMSVELRTAGLLPGASKGNVTEGFVRKVNYRVLENGKIEQVNQILPDDWAGAWQLTDERPSRESTLRIEPAGAGFVQFRISMTWREETRTQEISGKASIEGTGAAYQRGDCLLFFELAKGELVKVRHFNPGGCDGTGGMDFSGQYFKNLVGPEVDRNRPLAVKKLVEDPDRSMASCIAYKVVNEEGVEVSMPQQFRSLLECPVLVSLSPDGRYLVVNDGMAVRMLDFLDSRTTELMVAHNDSEGMSPALWSPDGSAFAFFDINQSRYEGGTKLFAFVIKDGRIDYKYDRELKANRVCAAICTVNAGRDFWFEGNQVIAYRTFNKEPFDMEGNEAVRRVKI
jgi:hypothetical protein